MAIELRTTVDKRLSESLARLQGAIQYLDKNMKTKDRGGILKAIEIIRQSIKWLEEAGDMAEKTNANNLIIAKGAVLRLNSKLLCEEASLALRESFGLVR